MKVRTHCKRGHEWIPENLYIRVKDKSTGKLARQCRLCQDATLASRRRTPAQEKAYYERHKDHRQKKNRAYAKVQRALLSGKLVKPEVCEECSSVAKLEAHHDDYDKQLEVKWLCRFCHRRTHGLGLQNTSPNSPVGGK